MRRGKESKGEQDRGEQDRGEKRTEGVPHPNGAHFATLGWGFSTALEYSCAFTHRMNGVIPKARVFSSGPKDPARIGSASAWPGVQSQSRSVRSGLCLVMFRQLHYPAISVAEQHQASFDCECDQRKTNRHSHAAHKAFSHSAVGKQKPMATPSPMPSPK